MRTECGKQKGTDYRSVSFCFVFFTVRTTLVLLRKTRTVCGGRTSNSDKLCRKRWFCQPIKSNFCGVILRRERLKPPLYYRSPVPLIFIFEFKRFFDVEWVLWGRSQATIIFDCPQNTNRSPVVLILLPPIFTFYRGFRRGSRSARFFCRIFRKAPKVPISQAFRQRFCAPDRGRKH